MAMALGGTAWRGWFPLHGELTSGTPDHKEGYYFGRELDPADPRVRAGVPLHGPNLFPTHPADLGPTVLAYLDVLEALGRRLTQAVSVGLGLGPDDLVTRWFRDPVILLRLFRYPPAEPSDPARGVGEHTDYGFLTLLWQDQSGGLEVRTDDGWQEVEPRPDAFVCNLGDMLDRLTGGRYRSTAHRVRSPADRDRIAIPFFFDPDWDRARRHAPPGRRRASRALGRSRSARVLGKLRRIPAHEGRAGVPRPPRGRAPRSELNRLVNLHRPARSGWRTPAAQVRRRR